MIRYDLWRKDEYEIDDKISDKIDDETIKRLMIWHDKMHDNMIKRW